MCVYSDDHRNVANSWEWYREDNAIVGNAINRTCNIVGIGIPTSYREFSQIGIPLRILGVIHRLNLIASSSTLNALGPLCITDLQGKVDCTTHCTDDGLLTAINSLIDINYDIVEVEVFLRTEVLNEITLCDGLDRIDALHHADQIRIAAIWTHAEAPVCFAVYCELLITVNLVILYFANNLFTKQTSNLCWIK